jgi:hypothetical protein
MLPSFPKPAPEPIDRFSPTLANALLACPRRVAFGRDDAFTVWKRPSTFSVLGDAAHALADVVAKARDWSADPNERRRQLEARWDDRISAGLAKLAGAWAPSVPPPPEQWPSYQVTRSRTLRRAERVLSARRSPYGTERGSGGGSPRGATGTEVELNDPVSGLVGRADRIDRVDGNYRVVDLKTGMYQGEPKEDQLRQLLLYAVLLQRSNGQWPAEIAIENASGEQFVLALDPTAAELLLTETVVEVSSFNERAADRTLDLEARPGPETCRWCDYRTCCDAYWQALQLDWGHQSVVGSIELAGTDELGAHADLHVVAPLDLGATETHITGLSELPQSGARWLAAADLRQIRDPRSLGARWSSRIATW